MNSFCTVEHSCSAAVHTLLSVVSTCNMCKYLTNETLGMMVVVADVKIAGVWGEWRGSWTDGWVICFPAYWCWFPVMFALAAFCRALPRKLACPFPPLHSQALMRALAFTLHLPSSLSPTPMVSSHMVSAVHVSRHSPVLFSSFLYFLSSYASLRFLSDGLPTHPVLYLLHPPNHQHHFPHVFSDLFILAFSSCIPLLICFPSSFIPPCQPEVFFRCSVKVWGAAIEA